MSTVLTITIPAVLVAYGVYVLIRLIKNRKKGCGCGCGSCPMNGQCHTQSQKNHP